MALVPFPSPFPNASPTVRGLTVGEPLSLQGNFGALPYHGGDVPIAYDCSDKIEAMLAAMRNNIDGVSNLPAGAGTIGPGLWNISRPIWIDQGATTVLTGAGRDVTTILPGVTSGGSTYVQSFAGPVIMTGRRAYTPVYGADILGGAGRSLRLDGAAATSIPFVTFNDAYWWRHLDDSTLHTGSIQLNVKFNSLTNWPGNILGSRGSKSGLPGVTDAFAFLTRGSNSGDTKFTFITTFATGGCFSETADGSVTTGIKYNLEISWDGSHVYCFVDGVLLSTDAASGGLKQPYWEDIGLGTLRDAFSSGDMLVQSVRLSKVCRHTSGFTPPTTNYAWDSDTYALYNWDQGDPSGLQPWIIGQTAPSTGYGGVKKLHYARIAVQPNVFNTFILSGMTIYGFNTCSGILVPSAPSSTYRDLRVHGCTDVGFDGHDASSFYCTISDMDVSADNVCFKGCTGLNESVRAAGGKAGVLTYGGIYTNVSYQPGAGSVQGFFARSDSIFNQLLMQGCSVDDEGSFPLWTSGLLIDSGATMVFESCSFGSSGAPNGTPDIQFQNLYAPVTFRNCLFDTNSAQTEYLSAQTGPDTFTHTYPITVESSVRFDLSIPWCATPGLVVEVSRGALPQSPVRVLNASTLSVDAGGIQDYEILVKYSATGACTVTLPVPTVGRTLVVQDSGGNSSTHNISIAPNAAENINGANSAYTISTDYKRVSITSDGTDWFVG